MKTKRNRAGLHVPARPMAPTTFDDSKSLIVSGGGRWATSQLKAAVLAGKGLTSQCLRTLDTLRHEEWKYFDDVVVQEALRRLIGVKDLMNAGLVKTVPNALGKTIYNYERETFMDPAEVSLDGISRTSNDRQEFDLKGIPLPITHKDFFINLRTLAASREKGEPLDTTQVATAGRVVAEMAETMLFQGGKTFGGLTIYGYTNFPDRLTSGYDGGKSWDDVTKLGDSFVNDCTVALTALAAKRYYGPFAVYVARDAAINMERDYSATGVTVTPGKTIRERLESIEQITSITGADFLPSGNVIFVQMTPDVVQWIQGETLQTVQWDEYGGFEINFKAWQIAVPLLKSDAQSRCGIYHFSK